MDTDQSPHSLQDSKDSHRGSHDGAKPDSIANEDSRDSFRSEEEEEEILASFETENSNSMTNLNNEDTSSSSGSVGMVKPRELGSLSREASLCLSDQVSGRSSATPGGEGEGEGEEREYERGSRDEGSSSALAGGGTSVGEEEGVYKTRGRWGGRNPCYR